MSRPPHTYLFACAPPRYPGERCWDARSGSTCLSRISAGRGLASLPGWPLMLCPPCVHEALAREDFGDR
jgi:hypothetical protein